MVQGYSQSTDAEKEESFYANIKEEIDHISEQDVLAEFGLMH